MPTAQGATIALCMIVRDEAAVIERCLASVRGLIDHWTICDTGSQDDTPTLIAEALHDVPGVLHERPWRDFGHNRSELMALAQGTADYLLLLDADMTLSWSAPPAGLHADAYLLRHAGEVAYWVPRLVRGDRRWRFEGVTHEYLAADAPFEQEPLEALVVEHHADGGSRADKLERDRRLLTAELARDPDDVRSMFYLAQTLRDMGEDELAVELYRRRARSGGWAEEAYYAAYQAGVLAGRRDAEAGIELLREAAQMRPERGEALYELARLCRQTARREEGYEAAVRGAALPVPDDVLFVHRDIHEWGLRYELALAAHWVGRPDEALELADALLGEGRLPPEAERSLRESREYFRAALAGEAPGEPHRVAFPALSDLVPGIRAGRIAVSVQPDWPQFNPSIAADGDGFRMIVRTANYVLHGDRYEILDEDGVVRTLNYLVRLSHDLAVTGIDPVADPRGGPPEHPSPVKGYEDLRLVAVDGRWLAVATTRDRNAATRCEIALLELGERGRIVRTQILRGPDPDRDEKNWMPFVDGGRLLLVYSAAPTLVLACDVRTGALERVSERSAPAWAREVRGGSQGVAVEGGWLFVVHEVVRHADPRIYVHRFVLLDEVWRLVAASPRFTFAGAAVEMCLGLAARDDDLVLTYGVHDASAWIAVVGTADVLATLAAV